MLTIEDLFAQPDNATVLQYLGLRTVADVTTFAAGIDNNPLDEGGQIFFHDHGRRVPPTARCRLDIVNLLVHERTARIFALHEGRCTIALRWHTTPDADDEDELDVLRGYTADADVDLSALGPGWALLDNVEEKGDLFWQAYELAGR